jgi:hypothetical protein
VGRIGDVSDVVDAILYLEDAPFVTGGRSRTPTAAERGPLILHIGTDPAVRRVRREGRQA